MGGASFRDLANVNICVTVDRILENYPWEFGYHFVALLIR